MPSHAVICYYDPNRLPLGRLPLPGITGSRQASLPVTRRDGAEEDLPISEHNPLTVPSPLRRRVPRCPLPVPGTFHGLRRSNSGSAPSWPACGEVCMTTLIRPRNFAPATDRPVVSPRFAPGLSTTHGGVPTGDPDVSPDPTFPGWLPQFARSSHVIWMSPSALGARADGHTLQLHPPPPPGADQQQPTTAPVPPPARQAAPQPPGPATLRDPQLTGMSRRRLDTLTSELTIPLAQQREHNRHQRRGSQRRRAAGAGAKDSLAPADRILATILYLRKLGTQDFLAELFGVARSTLTRAVQEVQPLLAERGHTIPPSTARFRTPADVTAFLTPEPAHPTSKPTR